MKSKIKISDTLIKDIYYQRKLYKLSQIKLSFKCRKYSSWIYNIESKNVKYITENDLLCIYRIIMPNNTDTDIKWYLRNLLSSEEIFQTNKEKCKNKIDYSYKKFLEKLESIDENDLETMKHLQLSFDIQMLSLLKEFIRR